MPDPMPRLLRSDATENRERVLDAARGLFAEEGLDVTMRQVARRAGVGPATLYRRFPTKQDLVAAAFDDELRACREVVESGAADADPWRGFERIVVGLTELSARNHGFVEAFTTEFPGSVDFAAHRSYLVQLLADLARRNQRAGTLRSDFVLGDLLLVLVAGRGLTLLPLADRPRAVRRFAVLALDGLRAASG